MNTEGSSTSRQRVRRASDPPCLMTQLVLPILKYIHFFSLFHPPSLSYVLPHNADGSHRSAELLMRFEIEPVTLRNFDVTDGRNGRAARIPCPHDL